MPPATAPPPSRGLRQFSNRQGRQKRTRVSVITEPALPEENRVARHDRRGNQRTPSLRPAFRAAAAVSQTVPRPGQIEEPAVAHDGRESLGFQERGKKQRIKRWTISRGRPFHTSPLPSRIRPGQGRIIFRVLERTEPASIAPARNPDRQEYENQSESPAISRRQFIGNHERKVVQ